MRHHDGFSPRVRSSIRVAARIVLFALIVQLAAIDHWQPDVASVVGIEGSQAHTQHCHGASSSCADSATITALIVSAGAEPLPPAVLAFEMLTSGTPKPEGIAATFEHPPRVS
jgi:hypothetical protein